MLSIRAFIIMFFFVSSIAWSNENKEIKILPRTQEALANLKLPGVKINLDEWSVDVDAEVCLHDGLLELILCVDNTKEHESIFSTKARALHIHTALLLMGSKPGTPAMKKIQIKGEDQWISVEPSGDDIVLSVVLQSKDGSDKEHPINKFVSPAAAENKEQDSGEMKKFPDKFIFSGSHLIATVNGKKKYLCEDSGNVISVSTFGDEMLCLSEVTGHDNNKLGWKVNPKLLPKIGDQVIIRLKSKNK